MRKYDEMQDYLKKRIAANKKNKTDLANLKAECRDMETSKLEDFIIEAVSVDSETDLTNMFADIAMDEYLKRDDTSLEFLEKIFFDTDDLFQKSSVKAGKLKTKVLVNDPENRIKMKIINHEYPIEKLKNLIDFLEENKHYHIFDRNSGPSTSWCDIMVEFMREGHYFTGKWPNETFAEK